ncbi:MAG: hypothetical protein AB1Z65_16855 [Candidatus Sulfomarinibacteraceae bacterium]
MDLRSVLGSAVVVVVLGVTPCSAAEPTGAPAGGTAAVSSWPDGCAAGMGLGATLLFPYFEVDLDDPNGITTLISVNNGLDEPGLARMIVWTDWGVPTLAFDIFLGPDDIRTVNLRSIFDGVIPSTGDPAALSGFPFCNVFPPFHDNPAVSGDRLDQLRAAHTGRQGPIDGLCSGADHGDALARGFITVDAVFQCGGLETVGPRNTPANPAALYFENGQPGGIASDVDMLWGDAVFLDGANNAAHGTTAVALWADPIGFGDNGIYTFYGRYSGWDGRDDRVPLPTEWVQRFLDGGPFSGGADLIVFRQANNADASPIPCGEPPPWYPLRAAIVTSDEDGGGVVTHEDDAFGLATQRVPIGALEPAPSAAFGRVRITGDADQLWVQPVLTGLGRFGVGLDGTPITTLCKVPAPRVQE